MVADVLENCRVIDFFQWQIIFVVFLQEKDVKFLVSSSQLITDQFSISGPRDLSNVRRSELHQTDDIRNRILY